MVLKKLFNANYKIFNLDKVSFFIFLILSIIILFLEVLNIYVFTSFIKFAVDSNNNFKIGFFDYFNINEIETITLITVIIIFVRCFASYLIKSFEFLYVYRILAKVTDNYFINILNLDYKKILNLKFSKLTNTLMNEVSDLVLCIFQPSILIFLEILISLTLIIYTFIFVDTLFIIISGLFAILYAAYYIIVNPINTSLGKKRVFYEQQRFNLISDNVRGIRHLKSENTNFLVNLLSETLYKYGDITAKKKIVVISSKYLLELIAYLALVILVTISYNLKADYFSDAITLVVVAFRLLPSFNKIISEAFIIKFNLPVIEKVMNINFIKNKKNNSKKLKNFNLNFNKFIKLSNISFKYNLSENYIFHKFSIKFIKNKITGITGKSGAGKTTLINIICGLLRVDSGKLFFDELQINDNQKLNFLSRNISLFSQDSFIFNGTIKENILFGENFDLERLKKTCKAMNIFEFISYKNLDKHIDPYKNNLSSGQIQRILLARTLYKKSLLYIFDEPTTNLDRYNQNNFLNYLKNNENTYLIVTHDNSLMKKLDKVIQIK